MQHVCQARGSGATQCNTTNVLQTPTANIEATTGDERTQGYNILAVQFTIMLVNGCSCGCVVALVRGQRVRALSILAVRSSDSLSI